MQYQGIFTKRTFSNSEGEKSTWYKVGYIKTTTQGGQFMRLFHQPDVDYFIFGDESSTLPEIQLRAE